MKKLLVVAIVLVVAISPLTSAKAAMSACELAAWSHWHPAYALGCVWEIIFSYTGGNAISPPADADGLSGRL